MDSKVFFEQGILPLRGFVSRKQAAAARDWIFSELTRLKIKDKGKIISSKVQKFPVFQQTGHLGQMVRGGEAIDRLFGEELITAMESLAASRLEAAHPHPQILLSLPHKEKWSLKNLNWHLDLAVPKDHVIPGIQAFVLIDDLQPQGGATLALAGSHRLHYLEQGRNAHGILRRSENFTLAPEKFLEPQDLHGIRTQIVEMSGRAGDVFLMDLRVLHSPSVNAKAKIRMMATNRFLKV